MPINISILGSTGSIGTQTLEVVNEFKKEIKVVGLAAGNNTKLLAQQIKKYTPKAISIKENKDLKFFKKPSSLAVYFGDKGNCTIATLPQAQIVVIATPGLAGINPTLAAIKSKKKIALATKEVLVSAGKIVTQEAKRAGVNLLPIDSEHSAIFQCLEGKDIKEVSKIIITASGGPFRGFKQNQLRKVTRQQALNHPNWKMGKKITIDSATLMNKGLEVIEAMWLFGISFEKIQVVIHPQSVIHSAVEFVDGSIMAQIGPSDMRIPIQYALLYPGKRQPNTLKRLSFDDYPALTFEKPDLKTFRCLELALQAAKTGGNMPAVMTAANDIAVDAFLKEKITFYKIPDIIEDVLEKHTSSLATTVEEIFEVDQWARDAAYDIVKQLQNKKL